MANITITAANVAPATGYGFKDGTAGATITAGQTVYQDAADSNHFKLADADATAATATVVGIALNGASDGQPVRVQTTGNINPGGTVVVGKVYVQSGDAGGIAPIDDLATGDRTTVLGIGTTVSNIKLSINNSGALVPAP